jgi:dipeptidyl-peptidase-4
MKIFYLILSGLVINCFLYAQNNTLNLEDALLKARTTLAPENLKSLQFIHGTNEYVYLKNRDGKETWMKGNINSESEFLTLDQLNTKLKLTAFGNLETMPAIQFNKSAEWIFSAKGNKMAYHPVTNAIRVLIPKELISKNNLEESSNGNLAYTEKDNLFVFVNGKTIPVTTDGTKDIVYGSSVHREEFGITKGLFWSSDGKQLAFYRMDQQMVTDYPMIDWSETPAVNNNIKYPMAGGQSHQVTVAVFNTATSKTVYLQTGLPAEQYLTNIAWSPDSRFVYIAVLNRAQNEMHLNEYDASNGVFIRTLFTEKDDKYTEPLTPLVFLPNNPKRFIWQSNRDGYNHLYLYNINGTVEKQITIGKGEVLENKGFDAKGENIFYVAADSRGLTKKLYSYNFKKGLSRLLTPSEGTHNTGFSSDGSAILDSYSSSTLPRCIQLLQNNKTKNLLQALNPLKELDNTKMDLFAAVNRHGDTLNVKTYYPANYVNNGSVKYPAIVYWYGGPHAQMVTNSWNAGSGDYWFKYMAQQGFMIIVPDVRGSDNRGKEFEQSMFRELGKVQMEDLEDVLKYYDNAGIDKKRMGLFGWSFGGFMTTDFVLNHPGTFKAAVAGGPVMDWHLYEIMYTERYMDTPAENPDGYKSTNLIDQAGKLKDRLLLIHGLQDPVVVQQHSVNFVKAAVDKGVLIDYMIYPGHEHNVTGKDRLHLYRKITDYFMLHLK